MNPVLVQIGPLQVHWYGVLIVAGALLAAWLSTIEARRRGEDPDHVWDLMIWVLILGIIGARLYHVFSTPNGTLRHLGLLSAASVAIVAFWNGGFRGLGIFGAVIGGVLGVALFTWHHISTCCAGSAFLPRACCWRRPSAASATGSTRSCTGRPATLPWAFHINPAYPCQEPAGSPMACGQPANRR